MRVRLESAYRDRVPLQRARQVVNHRTLGGVSRWRTFGCPTMLLSKVNEVFETE